MHMRYLKSALHKKSPNIADKQSPMRNRQPERDRDHAPSAGLGNESIRIQAFYGVKSSVSRETKQHKASAASAARQPFHENSPPFFASRTRSCGGSNV
jgi:hypothetical protein